MADPCAGMRARMAHYRVRAEALDSMIAEAVEAFEAMGPDDREAGSALERLAERYRALRPSSREESR